MRKPQSSYYTSIQLIRSTTQKSIVSCYQIFFVFFILKKLNLFHGAHAIKNSFPNKSLVYFYMNEVIMPPIQFPDLSTANIFSSQAESIHEQYISEWTDWAKSNAPGENREVALTRLKLCLQNNECLLDLSSLGLSSIPALPSNITILNARHNSLISLPELPDFLKELDVSNNNLASLPELPTTLEVLNVGYNQLENLPQQLNSIKYLFAENNRLNTLPILPNVLEFLHVYNNELVSLPALPHSLELLRADDNNITALPLFPTQANGPDREYYFNRNQITHVPESLFRLDQNCTISIENNPLSPRTWLSMLRRTSQSEYRGPQIHFSMSDGQQHTPVRSLPDAVAAWFPESLRSEVSQRWAAFTDEENAATFSAFLDRLADTVTA
ncbi:leucine-rich repeat domain-containing protein, partial [Escherichia coli]|uniref:leucine-rich repeat domain-containing protein n=2 Tax=Escherichia coli TaxID=562 RepID=UPI00278BCA8E